MPSFDQIRVPLGFAVIAVYLLWLNRGDIAGLVAKAWSMVPSLPTRSIAVAPASMVAVDEDTLDYQALKRLQARADRRNCPECKAAVQAYISHWFKDSAGV